MFGVFGKLKTKIESEMGAYEDKRAFEIEETTRKNEATAFLKNLKALSEQFFPYKNPKNFNGFLELKTLDEIHFRTQEGRYTFSEMVRITGLTTIRYVGGWDCDSWEASYREYATLYESSGANTARKIQVALIAVHSKIRENESDYENFIIKYTDTIANLIEIINQFGAKFILEDVEMFEKIKNLISSFAQDYDNYTGAIKEFKKAQVLEKLDLEQKYVDKMISDSSFLLEFSQK